MLVPLFVVTLLTDSIGVRKTQSRDDLDAGEKLFTTKGWDGGERMEGKVPQLLFVHITQYP